MHPQPNDRIDQILASLDKAQRVPAPSFFYTRLRARLDQPQQVEQSLLWLRPIPVVVMLLVLLAVNFWLINTPEVATVATSVAASESTEEELQTLAFEDHSTEQHFAEYEMISDPNLK